MLDEIRKNNLKSEKLKKVSLALNYIEQLLILVSAIIGWVSVSGFVSLVLISIESSAVGLKNCAITTVAKKYMWIVMKKRKMRDKIVCLANIS